MSEVTPQSELAAHCQFAVRGWSLFCWGSVFDTPIYLLILKKLLATDLLTCLVKANARNDLVFLRSFQFPHLSAYFNDSSNLIVPQSHRDIFESEPLVQQAVAHVASSMQASMVYFMNQPPEMWPEGFDETVCAFLAVLKRGENTPNANCNSTALESN